MTVKKSQEKEMWLMRKQYLFIFVVLIISFLLPLTAEASSKNKTIDKREWLQEFGHPDFQNPKKSKSISEKEVEKIYNEMQELINSTYPYDVSKMRIQLYESELATKSKEYVDKLTDYEVLFEYIDMCDVDYYYDEFDSVEVTYNDLVRYPEEYLDYPVRIHIYIGNKFSDNLYIAYASEFNEVLNRWDTSTKCLMIENQTDDGMRWIEGDVFEIFGSYEGLKKYNVVYQLTGKKSTKEYPTIVAKNATFLQEE